jgi:hypothetical protein
VSRGVNIRIPAAELFELDSLAERLGISRTDVILNAIMLQNEILSAAPQAKGVSDDPAL